MNRGHESRHTPPEHTIASRTAAFAVAAAFLVPTVGTGVAGAAFEVKAVLSDHAAELHEGDGNLAQAEQERLTAQNARNTGGNVLIFGTGLSLVGGIVGETIIFARRRRGGASATDLPEVPAAAAAPPPEEPKTTSATGHRGADPRYDVPLRQRATAATGHEQEPSQERTESSSDVDPVVHDGTEEPDEQPDTYTGLNKADQHMP